MDLSGQFWASVGVEATIGVGILAMMRQQLKDLVGWMRTLQSDVRGVAADVKDHEGRLSHVEGRLQVARRPSGVEERVG
jgi:hypothetical protein